MKKSDELANERETTAYARLRLNINTFIHVSGFRL